MAHELTNPLDALKDPFEHSADGYHWSFFPTAGLEIEHLPVSRFVIFQTIAFLIVLAVFVPACRRIARGDEVCPERHVVLEAPHEVELVRP